MSRKFQTAKLPKWLIVMPAAALAGLLMVSTAFLDGFSKQAGEATWRSLTGTHEGSSKTTNPPMPPVIINHGKNTKIQDVFFLARGTAIENRGDGLDLQRATVIQMPN